MSEYSEKIVSKFCSGLAKLKRHMHVGYILQKFTLDKYTFRKFQMFGKISYCTERFRGNGIQKYDFQTDEQTDGQTDMGRC